MNADTIDDLEERLRAACHAAIPRLLDNADHVREADTSDADSPPLQLRTSPTTDDRLPALRRSRFVSGIAAAVLLAAAAAAIATHDQPVPHLGSPDSLVTPTNTLQTSGDGDWAKVPGPPLEPRWQNVSISTGTGWFVWGGIGPLAPNQTVLDDGAYLDSATGKWRLLPPAPLVASTQVDFGLWTGREIVVIQGGDAVHMAAFDPTSFTWRTIPIPSDTLAGWPRGDGGFNRGVSSFVDGRVVIFFPNDPEGGLAPQVLLYDPTDDTFEVGATPPSSMTSLTGPITSSDSKLFVVGGGQHNTDSSCLPAWSLYTYDVPSNVWTSFGIIRGNWMPATAAWIDGRVVLAGGTECTTNNPVRMTMTFDPKTPSMSTRAEMPVDLPEVRGPAVTLGGEVAIVAPSGQLLTYDPAQDVWQIGPSFLPESVSAGETTMVALGTEQLAVWSAGIIHDDGGGNSSCCYPTGEAFTYSPSAGNQRTVDHGSAAESPTTVDQQSAGAAAVWAIDPSQSVTSSSESLTVAVMRLGCNGGVTGPVRRPSIQISQSNIVVTFTVEPLPPGTGARCPGNDQVAYTLDLGEPIGDRQLVDGACVTDGDAGTTSYCADSGVRWQP